MRRNLLVAAALALGAMAPIASANLTASAAPTAGGGAERAPVAETVVPELTSAQRGTITRVLRRDGADRRSIERVLSDPASSSQVAVRVRRSVTTAAVAPGARVVGRRLCWNPDGATDKQVRVVGENVLGWDLYWIELRSYACMLVPSDTVWDGRFRRSSVLYQRDYGTTDVGSPWSIEWDGKRNDISKCRRWNGVAYCGRLDAFTRAHAKLGIGDAAQHSYPKIRIYRDFGDITVTRSAG